MSFLPQQHPIRLSMAFSGSQFSLSLQLNPKLSNIEPSQFKSCTSIHIWHQDRKNLHLISMVEQTLISTQVNQDVN